MKHLLLVIYCPEKYSEIIKQAAFSEGAGIIGNYEECAWQTHGTGQFKALSNSKPFVGTISQNHKEDEIKVEMLIKTNIKNQVVQAVKNAHPYETPLIYTVRIDV